MKIRTTIYECRCVDNVYLGLALMAEWSKVLPLTASSLSPLSGFESAAWHVGRLPVTES